MKRLIFLLSILIFASVTFAQIDTAKWKYNPNKTDNKYDKVLNKTAQDGKAPGEISAPLVYPIVQDQPAVMYVEKEINLHVYHSNTDGDVVADTFHFSSPKNYYVENIFISGTIPINTDIQIFFTEEFKDMHFEYDSTCPCVILSNQENSDTSFVINKNIYVEGGFTRIIALLQSDSLKNSIKIFNNISGVIKVATPINIPEYKFKLIFKLRRWI